MTWIITGAGAGLGRAMAEQIVGQGGSVMAVDRAFPNPAIGQPVTVDLLAEDMPQTILDQCKTPITGVIHCAGINATGAFADIPCDKQAQVMAVNLTSPMRLTNALIAAGRITPNTRLCFVASLSCFVGCPGAAAYAASKDGLRSYAASLRKAGVARSVTTAYPGPLRTDHASRYAPDNSKAAVARRMPAKDAARIIYADITKVRRTSLPCGSTKLTAWAGYMAPGAMGRVMRKAVFEKLTDVKV